MNVTFAEMVRQALEIARKSDGFRSHIWIL